MIEHTRLAYMSIGILIFNSPPKKLLKVTLRTVLVMNSEFDAIRTEGTDPPLPQPAQIDLRCMTYLFSQGQFRVAQAAS